MLAVGTRFCQRSPQIEDVEVGEILRPERRRNSRPQAPEVPRQLGRQQRRQTAPGVREGISIREPHHANARQ